MKILQKLKTDLAKDRQTLKTLTFRQKLRFITDYYRGYAFILICLCMVCFYLGDMWLQASRETVLEGFFTNDDENLYPARDITRDFSRCLGLSSDSQVVFDDSLYVLVGSSVDYHTASQGKIIAYVSARELDFLVTTKELAEYYSQNLPFYDLSELLPDHLMTRLQDQLCYTQDSQGAAIAYALSMEGSRFEKKAASPQTAPHYLVVLSYTNHQDAMIRFLEYAFEDD